MSYYMQTGISLANVNIINNILVVMTWFFPLTGQNNIRIQENMAYASPFTTSELFSSTTSLPPTEDFIIDLSTNNVTLL